MTTRKTGPKKKGSHRFVAHFIAFSFRFSLKTIAINRSIEPFFDGFAILMDGSANVTIFLCGVLHPFFSTFVFFSQNNTQDKRVNATIARTALLHKRRNSSSTRARVPFRKTDPATDQRAGLTLLACRNYNCTA